MTTETAKEVLRCPFKFLVLLALEYVNLTDRERVTLILRHMRGHTQEQVAELFDRSVNTVQTWEKSALDKCCKAWDGMGFIKEILSAGK